jgi:oligopeptide transport system substrate-binding protein
MGLNISGLSPVRRIILCLWWISGVGWIGCNGPGSRDKQVFRYNQEEGIGTLDPAFAKNIAIIWATHQLYNTLVETDSALRLVPSLATRWTVSSDHKVYTFHLRTDVDFQDDPCFAGGKGRPFTAADVVYSFKRLVDPATASSGAWIFNGRIDPVSGFSALNDSTFQLTLLSPFRPILGALSMEYCSIVPREAITRYGKEFRSHPVGTGPFRMESWDEGQALILVRNGRYWEKDSAGHALPYLDAVKISFLDSKATEFLQFLQGGLDMVNDIDPSYKDEILTRSGTLKAEWAGKIVLSKHPQLDIEYLGILVDPHSPLVEVSPLRWKKVRQAINMAVDRRKMLLYLRNSIGLPAESGFIPAGLPVFDSVNVRGYRYDPDSARKLLAQAGFGRDNPVPVIRLVTIPTHADLASFVASECQEAGINIQVEVVQKSLLLEETAKSDVPFFKASWVADYPDAENFLSLFYSKNPAPPNYTRFSSPVFDALYEKALAEDNDSLRKNQENALDRIIIEAAPVVPLWYDEALRLVQPSVTGLTPNGLNLLELRRVRQVYANN